MFFFKKRKEGVDDIETGTVFMDLYVPLCMAVALVVVTNDFFLVFFLSGNLKKFLLINIVI
jgi:hypothetical protein